jgi:hypothetical protein
MIVSFRSVDNSFPSRTITNRIYLFNSAYKQIQNCRPPRSFDFQLRLKINLRKQEKSFQRSDYSAMPYTSPMIVSFRSVDNSFPSRTIFINAVLPQISAHFTLFTVSGEINTPQQRTVQRHLHDAGFKRRRIVKSITIRGINQGKRRAFCRSKYHWNVREHSDDQSWHSSSFSGRFSEDFLQCLVPGNVLWCKKLFSIYFSKMADVKSVSIQWNQS